MNTFVKRLMGMILSVVLVIAILPVYAETDSSFVKEGTYEFSSVERSNKQIEDRFVFRTDCFMRPSGIACDHLAEVSARLAEASAARFGMGEDSDLLDDSNSSYNIENMLRKMGFTDVRSNEYCRQEKLEDSIGVTVGHASIAAYGRTYTLLAVMPRSAGYRQEWAGNFIIGDSMMHVGFKAARDEVLRFIRQYVKDLGIKGNLKVYVAGHSRGGAVANLVAAYFAAGDISYVSSNVSITPDDVYGYTYAAPNNVVSGITMAQEHNVSGNRQGHPFDTPGNAYTSNAKGTTDPYDNIYNGIHNYRSQYDMFPLLPLRQWGYTVYGQTINLEEEKDFGSDKMMDILAGHGSYAYEKYTQNNPEYFSWNTFDLADLSLAPIEREGGFEAFLRQRIAALGKPFPSAKAYVDANAQEALKSFGGIFGMADNRLQMPQDTLSVLFKPLSYTYLAYAFERLKEEEKATTDGESTAIAIEGLLEYFSGKPIDHDTFTVDDATVMILEYLVEHENDPVADKALSYLIDLIPKRYHETLISIFSGYLKGSSPKELTPELMLRYVKVCLYGAERGSRMYYLPRYREGKTIRGYLYFFLATILSDRIPNISSLIGMSNSATYDGSGIFHVFIEGLMPVFLRISDEEGNIIGTYENIADAADAYVCSLLDSLFVDIAQDMEKTYGLGQATSFRNHLKTLKENVRSFRVFFSYVVFYTEGKPFDTKDHVELASTFMANAGMIPPSHYPETYVARICAVTIGLDHGITHVDGTLPTCGKFGQKEHWAYAEGESIRFFADRHLAKEMTKEELVIAKTEHQLSQPVKENIIEASEQSVGSYDEVVYCLACHEELSRTTIVVPRIDPAACRVFGFCHYKGKHYWYEDHQRQGIIGDPKNIWDTVYGLERGREIYDPESDGWYWLDAVYDGAKALGKEVWMPYIYQQDLVKGINKQGKWVRYDNQGKMIKGWYTVQTKEDCERYPFQVGNTYYYDPMTGEMAKGNWNIEGNTYRFDEVTGVLRK